MISDQYMEFSANTAPNRARLTTCPPLLLPFCLRLLQSAAPVPPSICKVYIHTIQINKLALALAQRRGTAGKMGPSRPLTQATQVLQADQWLGKRRYFHPLSVLTNYSFNVTTLGPSPTLPIAERKLYFPGLLGNPRCFYAPVSPPGHRQTPC